MGIIFNLFVSVIHFILTYGIFITALVSNNIKVLFVLLVIMNIIKILYFCIGRCVLTLYEYNNYFSPVAELFSKTLTTNLPDKQSEEIVINVGLLIILNKLLFLSIYNYYIK
jgi:hypothetical protein